MNQTVGVVSVTTEYGKFNLIKGNRDINLLNLGRIKRSIMQKQLSVPIIVNEKFEIIDGQHRFTVLKELELPIYFIKIEGYGLSECQILNSCSKSWSPQDYLNGYVNLGNKEYIKVKEFREKYSFLSIKMCQILLVGGQTDTGYAQTFKEGLFKILDYEKGCQLAEKMQDFKLYPPFYNTHFQLALLTMFTNKEYDHEQMLQKLVYQGNKLTKETRVREYLTALTEIYNYKTRGNEKIYFYNM